MFIKQCDCPYTFDLSLEQTEPKMTTILITDFISMRKFGFK